MSMIKKIAFPRLSFKYLPEKNGDIDYFIQEDLDRVTKLYIPAFKTHIFDRVKTQDVKITRRASYSRKKLPSLEKRLSALKESLAPHICFGLNEMLMCSHQQLAERNIFRVKKLRNSSVNSYNKQNSKNCEQNCFQNKKQDNQKEIYVIDLLGNNLGRRRRSQIKNYQPCKIANTRKLPFQIQLRNKKHLDISDEFQNDNISSIRKIPQQSMLTQQSFKDLYKFL